MSGGEHIYYCERGNEVEKKLTINKYVYTQHSILFDFRCENKNNKNMAADNSKFANLFAGGVLSMFEQLCEAFGRDMLKYNLLAHYLKYGGGGSKLSRID